jgi:hypothetical protein
MSRVCSLSYFMVSRLRRAYRIVQQLFHTAFTENISGEITPSATRVTLPVI